MRWKEKGCYLLIAILRKKRLYVNRSFKGIVFCCETKGICNSCKHIKNDNCWSLVCRCRMFNYHLIKRFCLCWMLSRELVLFYCFSCMSDLLCWRIESSFLGISCDFIELDEKKWLFLASYIEPYILRYF